MPYTGSVRNSKGYTLIELMVAISILAIVLGLIYGNYNKGMVLFHKSFQYGKLQTNARSALQAMANNIKQANKGMVYVGDGYNSNVPLPRDYAFGKPYIYFTIPVIGETKESQDLKAKVADRSDDPYDYYLYYIAFAKDRDDNLVLDRAKLKLLKIKNQDGIYTNDNSRYWPIMPPSLLGKANYDEEEGVTKTGIAADVAYNDLSDEFSLYQSEFAYYYFTVNYEHLFKIKVKLVDPQTNSNLEFETAVTPRN